MLHIREYAIIPSVKKLLTIVVAILATCSQARNVTGKTIRCARDLAALRPLDQNFNVLYDFEAQVVCMFTNNYRLFMVQDETGSAIMANHHRWPNCGFSAGDTIKVAGFAYAWPDRGLYIAATNTTFVHTGTPPVPEDVSAANLLRSENFPRFVRLTGLVHYIRHDDIDRGWSHLLVSSGGESVHAFICQSNAIEKTSSPLQDSVISVVGICRPFDIGNRRFIEPTLVFDDINAITIIKQAPRDPFEVPVLEDIHHVRAARIADLGRRKVSGRVLATWRKNRILLRSDNGRLIKVETDSMHMPPYGAYIQASGIPATDLYRINLTCATWRTIPNKTVVEPKPATVSARNILSNKAGEHEVKIKYHGTPIRFKGIVRGVPASGDSSAIIMVESEGHLIPVDADGCPDAISGIGIGYEIETSGICVMDTENWLPNGPVPQIDSVRLVVRTPADVKILTRPPWWTPLRLSIVIGALLVILGGIFIWNRTLNRIIERRTRELLKERFAHDNANLKVEERMRLAVELHDTIAQNLTGVMLQVDAAELAAENDPKSVKPYLETVRRKLKNSSENLRYCLWDLRSRAFDEKNLADAIRKTLAPHVGKTKISIDCDIKCRDLSDNSIHAVLCIIRELAINAVRHGKATHMEIDGALSEEGVSFTVKDDGCGFDTKHHPGPSEGHFGLQGVAERVHRLEGSFSVQSSPEDGSLFTFHHLNPQA